MGREEAEGVIAPVVAQPQLAQAIILQELVDWQQLDGCHTQVLEVVDDGRVCHAGIGSAQLLRNIRVRHRHALDVGFVDDGFVIWRVGAVVAVPLEEGINHHRQHCVA